jgi:hypothetical protein
MFRASLWLAGLLVRLWMFGAIVLSVTSRSRKRKYSPLEATKSPLAGLAKMRAHIRQS